MPDEITPILLEKAAEKYAIPYKKLRQLAEDGKIATSRRGSVYIADENSIKAYLELDQKVQGFEAYQAQIIAEKQEEVNEIISQYDDFLFAMRTLNKTTHLFRVLIREFAQVIPDESYQKIFIEVSLGQSIYLVASKMNLTYDRVCAIYSHAVDIIEKKSGLLIKYRQIFAQLLSDRHRKDIEIRNLKGYIKQLENFKGIENKKLEKKNIPEKALDLLTLRLQELPLSNRTMHCLMQTYIYTIEDLIRYLAKHEGNLGALLSIPNFGNASLKELKQILRNYQIIDINEYCFLLEYVVI